jgi:hypothetical protein
MNTLLKMALPVLAVCFTVGTGNAQGNNTSPLLGRWEVVSYSEQGVPVDKKQPGLSQALNVYAQVRAERGRVWYGYDPDDEQSRKRVRAYERWEERDSTQEVSRVAEAIEMPYFVVFFADSTMALYNKVASTGQILFPEARRYVYAPATSSIDIFSPGAFGYLQWNAQILAISDREMVLFLPEEAEVVRLVKTAYTLP